MSVYAGLDGGSTYLKAALIDQTGRVLNTGWIFPNCSNVSTRFPAILPFGL